MIFESLGDVWAVESMRHPWEQFVDDFRVPRVVCSVNPCVTLGSSLVDDFLDIMGSLRFRIHESPVEAVSLMISKAAGALCIVESMQHRSSSLVDYF
jgi:hypothetical protein